MKKFNPSVLALSISSLLLTSTLTFGQIQQQDKALFGVKEHQESLLFHQSLVKQGSDNVPIWRIPSLLRTKDGVLIAAADKRWQHRGDWGDIDTAIRISHDDGKTWGNITTILDLPSQNGEKSPIHNDAPNFNPWAYRRNGTDSTYRNSSFLIDAQMVQDKRNGRIFLAVDMFPESTGLSGTADNGVTEFGSGYVNIGGKSYLQLKNGNARYTLRENGEVFDQNNNKTDYKVIINGDPKQNYKDLGDVMNSQGELLGNIYLKKEGKNAKVPFTAPHISYFWLTHSDDNGKTWSQPIDLTPQVKKDWMRFFGTGPGVGIQTQNGNLLFPIYYINRQGKQSSALIISKDGGKTWDLGQSPNDNRPDLYGQNSETLGSSSVGHGHELTESQLVELDNGDLKLFMRNTSGRVMMSTSKDGGYTWTETQKVEALKHGYSQLSVIKYSKKINGKEYIVFSGQSESGQSGDALRRNGKLFLGEVQEDGSIVWKINKLVRDIQSSGLAKQNGRSYPNGYVYSSMAELGDGSIGLAYENTTDYTTIMYLPIEMQEFFWKAGKIFSDVRQKEPLVFTYDGTETLEKIGDGVAIKRGEGESQSEINVSEGLLVLDQQTKDGKNKAFTQLTLNSSGVVQVNSTQNIDRLVVNNGATGYLQFTVTDTHSPRLKINQDVTAHGQIVAVQVNLQKKLKPNDKGYYHAQGEELIAFKDNGQVKWRLVNDELKDGMYVYTLASVAKPSVLRTTSQPHSLYLTNKLITADGKAVSTVAPLKAPLTVNARPQVNPVLASYLTANLALNKMSEQLQQSFMHETRLLQEKDRSIFVKYLNGKQKYGSNLSFIDYGYDFNASYSGVMLGGKVWQSERGNHALYTALNKTSYKVTPKAVDGETKAKYHSWGGSINWHSNLPHNLIVDLSAGYQKHKGDIEHAGHVKGYTFNIGADLGYRYQWMKNAFITPMVGLHYLYASLSDVNDQANKALLKYNNFNALKTNLGVDVNYRIGKFEVKGLLSYDMYQQKTRQLYVDDVAYKQGKLADTLHLNTQFVAHLTPRFAFSTEVGFQHARNKGQSSFAVGAHYQF
ncbi:sialidase family protein [Pasteurella multocida]|uniref:sialidase family protein n=1 Tax=Pasteurella multocida TaxID=747 RepID=UPI0009F3C900|nr:exo-alpha-sialidase [Pasteurella multocida]MCL7839748.1 exo-alpha-sialidase [Pasteurella multocida]PNM10226.1 autotransporter domain-containing protein [Pasteurella multocida]HDR1186909.1 exo-alpha-sialidase [Pasteurella multocida]HDR1197666.1 exo-alpha-sialidase [Pasteurella multocida]HDR1311295.1 exo-alpha-sialidase [Pasteurella multocida]